MAVAQVCADLCRAHAASVRTATDAQWAVGTELAQEWPLRFHQLELSRIHAFSASTHPASVQKQAHSGFKSQVFFHWLLTAAQQSQTLGHADNEDEKLLGPCFGIAEFDRGPIGISRQHPIDLGKAAMAVVLDEELRKTREFGASAMNRRWKASASVRNARSKSFRPNAQSPSSISSGGDLKLWRISIFSPMNRSTALTKRAALSG